MKSLKHIIIILAAIVTATACNKKLDVLPQQSVVQDNIKTSGDVKAVLFGGYSLLQSGGAFGEQYIFIPDLLADEDQVDFIGTFTVYRDLYRKRQDKTSSIAAGLWATGYTIINVTNTVLDKISLVDEDERDAIQGEAEFMRGITYFQLANLFGKPYSAGNVTANPAVPLVLTPTYVYDTLSKAKLPRATVAAIYNQVVQDLTDAAAKLPETAADGRATKYAAEAFLSRVYMSMADYTKASAMANDVINSANYGLLVTYGNAFNNVANTQEDIFAIQQTSQSNAGTQNAGIITFYQAQPAGRGDAQVDFNYFNHFDDANDARSNFFYEGVSIAGFDGIYTGKWAAFYKNIPVVRLAEMYLTRGEANLHAGINVGGRPATDYSTVRRRAGASTTTSVTIADFVEERFRELAFEGDRLWTLKRLKLDVGARPYDDDKLVLPIPQREIDVNNALVQNPGY